MSSSASSSRSASVEPVELPKELETLARHIEIKPESFAHGDADIQSSALEATKFLFDRAVLSESVAIGHVDDLLKSVQAPQGPVTRSASTKQPGSAPQPPISVPRFVSTPLDSLVLTGMGSDQIWEQLELRTKSICSVLDAIVEREGSEDEDGDEAEAKVAGPSKRSNKRLNFDSMDMDVDDEDDDNDDDDFEGSEDSEEEEESDDGEEDDLGEETIKLRDEDNEPQQRLPLWKGPRHPLLDDGFFSIDKFNRDTEAMEAKSKSSGRLKKRIDDEDDSDEDPAEEVDLFAPIGDEDSHDSGDDDEDEEMNGDDDESEDEEMGGLAAEDDEDDGEEDGSGQPNGRMNGTFKTEGVDSIMYQDFFRKPYRFEGWTPAPPPLPNGKPKLKASVRFSEEVRVRKIKARGKGRRLDMDDDDDDDFALDDVGLDASPFANPFFGAGPGGFGGFAPRKPVEVDNPPPLAAHPNGDGVEDNSFSFEGMNGAEDSEEGSADEEDEEESEGTDDEDEDEEEEEEDEEVEQAHQTMERLKDDIFAEPEPEHYRPPEMSTHEKRMAAIAQEIAILEDENVSTKPWALMGETNAKRRPENSLLETDLDFEQAAKPTPVITEEVTKSLEDLIKTRIMENRFDDVIRQRPMDDKPFLPSDVIELQDTQSKKSLAQIYEDDYAQAASGEARKGGASEKLQKEHEDLEKTWGDISYKLDALCNAHFTPKMPKATISTISNVASTTLESALPTSVSTSTLMAPEEVFAHDRRATKARTEMTPADKRALQSKLKQERKKRSQILGSAVVKFGGSGSSGGSASAAAGYAKQPKNVKEAKDMALESLVKTGKGVTVVGKPNAGSKNGKVKAKASLNGAAQLKL